MPESPANVVVLQVVHGERPLEDLENVGITIRLEAETIIVENPHRVVAAASLVDLARGLLKHQDNPRDGQSWARVVLAGSSFLDFRFDDSAASDTLIEGLWDAAFGKPVTQDALTLAKRLAKEGEQR